MSNFLLAVGGYSNTVLLKDASNGRVIRQLPFPDGEVLRVAFSGNGPVPVAEPLYLAVCGSLGRVRVFDVSTNDTPMNKYAPYTGHNAAVTACGFEPNRTSFAYSASEDGTLQTWRPTLINASGLSASCGTPQASQSGSLVDEGIPQGANGNREVVVFQPFHGPFCQTKFENWGPSCLVAIHDATYYPPKDLFFTVDALGRLRIWDHGLKKVRTEVIPHRSRRSINCVELSSDYGLLVLANYDGLLFVYDVKKIVSDSVIAKPLSFRGSSSYITRVRLSVSITLLVCTTKQDGVKVYRMTDVMAYGVPQTSIRHLVDETVTPHREYPTSSGWVSDAAFVGNTDEYLVTSSSNKEVIRWNLDDPQLTMTYHDLPWAAVTLAVKEISGSRR